MFEVPTIFLIHEDQIEIVLATESVIHVFISGCQIASSEVVSDRYAFTFDWSTVHQFILGQSLLLSIGILAHTDSLFSNDGQLHMLDFDSDQVEVNFSKDHVS